MPRFVSGRIRATNIARSSSGRGWPGGCSWPAPDCKRRGGRRPRNCWQWACRQADVRQGLPELLLAVGLYDQAVTSGKISGGGQEADPAVLARAADRAVADPASAPASLAGIREGAAMVSAALDALYAGDEGAALAALGEVPRNSPFAEWKLFVRGLAAYYRHDDEAMRANWDRLAPDRFAARLAAPLRRLADPAWAIWRSPLRPPAIRRSSARRFAFWKRNLCGGPVVWYLESLQRACGKVAGARPCSASAAGRRNFSRPCPVWPSGSIACSTTWRCGRPIQVAARIDDRHRSAALGSPLEPGLGDDRREGGRRS